MKNILWLWFFMLVISCQQKVDETTNDKTFDIKSQITNWKNQLVINGDVGNPCLTDTDKWSAKNPERFYGLPKDAIKYKVFDANKDAVADYLLYFPAGDCCSCEVGMNQASDFLKLIYSNGNTFLSNDNLREKIASKIEREFYTQNNMEVIRVVFSVTDFKENISGTYELWTSQDPDCCPSKKGTFKYNPFTFNIQITHQNDN